MEQDNHSEPQVRVQKHAVGSHKSHEEEEARATAEQTPNLGIAGRCIVVEEATAPRICQKVAVLLSHEYEHEVAQAE